tara:strand:- start:556 stop:717 length:162 start_codon:yes stop_codon:yes gene_type:complete
VKDKKYYSDVKFTARELIAILNVLKHSQQFGQSVAPEDTIQSIIKKIQDGKYN